MATVIRREKRRKQRMTEQARTANSAPTAVRFLEYADNRGATLKVDREAGVIPGVKVLGLVSRNGRRYLPEAVKSASGLYENQKVNVNHPDGEPTAPRDYEDRLGCLKNVRVAEDGGLVADLHYNPKHALAEQLAWDAEHAPENVGLSHNCQAQTRMDGKQIVVEKISSVVSVDLVADPATTRSLFEYDAGTGSAARMPDSNIPTSMDGPAPAKPAMEDDPMGADAKPADPKQAMHDSICAKIAALCEDPDSDPSETAATIKKLLVARAKMKDQMDAALADEGGDDEEDDDDGTEALRRKLVKGNNAVTEQNKELADAKAELESLKRKESARKLLEAAQLPAVLCDELLVEELANSDPKRQEKLIERQKILAEQLKLQRPRSRDEAMTEGFDANGGKPALARNAKELVESLSTSRY